MSFKFKKAAGWRTRLEHMLQAIRDIKKYTKNLQYDDFKKNDMAVHAVLNCFLVIGEASTYIPADVKDLYPEVEWPAIKGLRNIVAHAYERIDLRSVWKTIQTDLAITAKQLRKIKRDQDVKRLERNER